MHGAVIKTGVDDLVHMILIYHPNLAYYNPKVKKYYNEESDSYFTVNWTVYGLSSQMN